MKEIVIQLLYGLRKEAVPREYKAFVKELIKARIVTDTPILRIADEYRIGRIDLARNGYGYLEVIGAKPSRKAKRIRDLLIHPRDLAGATNGDIVIARQLGFKRQRPTAKVVMILERAYPATVVWLERTRSGIGAFNVKTGEKIPLKVTQKSLKQLPDGALLKIDNYSGQIVEVLGVLDDPLVDERISLALFDKHEEFSKHAIQEAASWGSSVDASLYPDRIDLTSLPFCTIDPASAKDFDDAIYFDLDTHTLYVAIADVSSYVHPFTQLDEEAKERGFSIYFPHKSIPMLPRNLSDHLCSLKPNEVRLAFTFEIRLDPTTLEPIEHKLYESIICSQRRFTYEQIDAYLEGATPTSEIDRQILSWLLPLANATQQMRKKRLEKGFDFASQEVRMEVNEHGMLTSTRIEEQTLSHSLIEECMLLANIASASYFDYGIFRIHPEPKPERINDLLVDLTSVGIRAKHHKDIHRLFLEIQAQAQELGIRREVDQLLIRTQQQARYATVNIGHFGLGFGAYSHFTSPIRRYADLMLHRLLKTIIKHEHKLQEHLLETMEALTVKISDLEREAARVEWDFKDRKFARWAADHIGEKIEAVIVEITPGKDSVATTESPIVGMRVFVKNDRCRLFDRVTIQITGAHLATTRISGRILEVHTKDV
ncbi:MAG: ribonuclease R [Campylobacterales bacterium]